MTRLIDADALDMYESLKSYYGDAWRDAQKEIDNAPTVDAVPVIRCKDCFKKSLCMMHRETNNDYGYCSWAGRKDNG